MSDVVVAVGTANSNKWHANSLNVK